MNNRQGWAEAYKEVIHEDAVEVGEAAKLAAARTSHDKSLIQRQIDATDRQIDRLVYELYGLSEVEIGIVEGK